MNNTGVLLINLGTPNNCDQKSVYRYLTEFLNDPRIIDLPTVLRWPLTNLIIVPFRYRKSAAAYQKIWKPEGSPLLTHSQKLKEALTAELGHEYQVEIAMRYGQPTIKSALKNLQDCYQIIAIPLFPQYSSAATGSAIAALLQTLAKQQNIPSLKVINNFYNNVGFIQAYADVIKQKLNDKKPELVLFSYHGLPERHISKSHCRAKCGLLGACPPVSNDNFNCYRAQCYETSRLLANAAGLEANRYQVTFQSRLGRTPWIKPYTDTTLAGLRQQGLKSVAIVCPSFVTDCLETLEEINIQARETWLSNGGSDFIFIPCVNEHPLWVKALGEMVRGIN